MDNSAKSNRAQADYFELLVAEEICQLYTIPFSYTSDLNALSAKVFTATDGTTRLKLQEDNLLKLKPEIKKILDVEIATKGKITAVLWTGRNLTSQSTGDVEVIHSSGKTGFSIKSLAKGGSGTMKNLGQNSLEKYYSIDFSAKSAEMWQKLRNHLGDQASSQLTLKERVNDSDTLLPWAKANGKPYQKELNDLCFEAFNSLSNPNKINFLNLITDCQDGNLFVVIVNPLGVSIYKPADKQSVLSDIVCAKDKTDGGYAIYINDLPSYRVQTNNTNGIGISAFCQRFFLMN